MDIDRKFIFTAVNPITGKIYTQDNALILCAKDKAVICAMQAYMEEAERIGANKEHIESVSLLVGRLEDYQANVESRVPDTLGLEIPRCLYGQDIQSPGNKDESQVITIGVDHGKEKICRIRGSEVLFEKDVPEHHIADIAQDIWDHPSKYSDYKDGSEAAFYKFLKFLWIRFPDGRDLQLAHFISSDNKD